MLIRAGVARTTDVAEIDADGQQCELEENSSHLKSNAISVIMERLCVREEEITGIEVLKKGMTNRSFLFAVRGNKYIMRIPGEGTDRLINRREEAAVYHAIRGMGLCDDPVYIDPENGYKITRYIEGVRCCDPSNIDDLTICMRKLRMFHDRKLSVGHEFDIFGKIDFYETLWEGQPSIYEDYVKTKGNVLSLRGFIEDHVTHRVLTHIDAISDNFLFDDSVEGELRLQLTDWEYAGMQDPHVDIAMFCIYSLYDRRQVDRLIDLYFTEGCSIETRVKIYCYIAVCGLLWSNWCEYKRRLGVEFGEYSIRQYRYAKDFYRIVQAELESIMDAGG